MANWEGAARSNYCEFKDIEGLRKSLQPFSDIRISDHGEKPNHFCLLADGDDGGFPSFTFDDEDNEIEFSFEEFVVPFLADGEVMVIVEAGHERLRYVSGHANAYAWDGRTVSLSLGDIYNLAAETFGIPVGRITEATN